MLQIEDYRRIFREVKKAVRRILGLERPGLTLAVQELPGYVEAYHPVGTHYIVVNSRILEEVSSKVGSKEALESYLFCLLLHEYLHSLGFDEEETYYTSVEVCRRTFGEDSLAVQIARYGLASILRKPDVEHEETEPSRFKIVGDLDLDNQSYIT